MSLIHGICKLWAKYKNIIHTIKAKLLLLKLTQKKLDIEETKTTKYSTFKTDIIKVGLVFSISKFFITKTSLANKWMRKKIPYCSDSALTIADLP